MNAVKYSKLALDSIFIFNENKISREATNNCSIKTMNHGVSYEQKYC
jgi:hypothetical protein